MASKDIPEEVRKFIFDYIDSVELLEVLLFLRSHESQEWDSTQISRELRSNETSIVNRLSFLKSIQLIEEKSSGHFIYSPGTHATLIQSLSECYKVRPHSILEIIFSPLKKAKQIANAFMFSPSKKGESDG